MKVWARDYICDKGDCPRPAGTAFVGWVVEVESKTGPPKEDESAACPLCGCRGQAMDTVVAFNSLED